ncbi:MAG: hypothetical protein ACK4UN_05975 [Limisphaerales bacterium]
MITFRATTAAKGRIDATRGVITGVSVITEGPAIGHNLEIDGTTLKQVKACADAFAGGVKVKTNHGSGFESIVGHLKSFSIAGNKTIADLHLLKNHPDFKKLVEMAQTMPECFGLSISFSGVRETINGKQYARCSELYSVDLVDSPAANPTGLFSVPIKTETLNLTEQCKMMKKLSTHTQNQQPDSNKPMQTKLSIAQLEQLADQLHPGYRISESLRGHSAAWKMGALKRTFERAQVSVPGLTEVDPKSLPAAWTNERHAINQRQQVVNDFLRYEVAEAAA